MKCSRSSLPYAGENDALGSHQARSFSSCKIEIQPSLISHYSTVCIQLYYEIIALKVLQINEEKALTLTLL